MITYICKFTLSGTTYRIVSTSGLYLFIHGFYLDTDFELSSNMNAKYWVPPHKIDYIEIRRENNVKDNT